MLYVTGMVRPSCNKADIVIRQSRAHGIAHNVANETAALVGACTKADPWMGLGSSTFRTLNKRLMKP
jgi:hypothetical protein